MTTAEIEMDSLAATETPPEFRIAIFYETPALGAAALRQCERLTERFHDSFLFRVRTESFSGLESETELQRTLADARGASMIFISAAGNVPASLVRWLKESLEHRDDDTPVALVDMIIGQTEDAANAHRVLRELAEINHLDLISQEHFQPPAAAGVARASALDSLNHSRNWGISE